MLSSSMDLQKVNILDIPWRFIHLQADTGKLN